MKKKKSQISVRTPLSIVSVICLVCGVSRILLLILLSLSLFSRPVITITRSWPDHCSSDAAPVRSINPFQSNPTQYIHDTGHVHPCPSRFPFPLFPSRFPMCDLNPSVEFFFAHLCDMQVCRSRREYIKMKKRYQKTHAECDKNVSVIAATAPMPTGLGK